MAKIGIISELQKKEALKEKPADELYLNQGDLLKVPEGRTQQIINTFAGTDIEREHMKTTEISKIVLRNVLIDSIKERDENNFISSDIEELANSIASIGLVQPVILKVNPNETEKGEYPYIVVAGHRRLRAMKYLRDRESSDITDTSYQVYSYIPARILSKNEVENEEIIYNDTNTKSREGGVTVFEMLLSLNIKKINFEDEDTRKDYIELCYGQNKYIDYLSGLAKFKFNTNEKNEYLTAKIEQKFKKKGINKSSVSTYAKMIEDSSNELIKAVLDGRIPLKEARNISRNPYMMQIELIETHGTTEYEDALSEAKMTVNSSSEKNKTREVKYDDILKIEATIKRNFKEFDEIIAHIDKKKLNGNQKEYISEFTKCKKRFVKLQEIEKK